MARRGAELDRLRAKRLLAEAGTRATTEELEAAALHMWPGHRAREMRERALGRVEEARQVAREGERRVRGNGDLRGEEGSVTAGGSTGTPTARAREWITAALKENPELGVKEALERAADGVAKRMRASSFQTLFYQTRRDLVHAGAIAQQPVRRTKQQEGEGRSDRAEEGGRAERSGAASPSGPATNGRGPFTALDGSPAVGVFIAPSGSRYAVGYLEDGRHFAELRIVAPQREEVEVLIRRIMDEIMGELDGGDDDA